MTRHTSRGTCAFCSGEQSKSGMTKHLESCKKRPVTSLSSEPEQAVAEKRKIYHLLVEARLLPIYWLHLEIAAESTLALLDRFLRDLWLECCNHLSAFEIDGLQYRVDEGLMDGDWNRRQRRMDVCLDYVLLPEQTFTYDYDFGSTTELVLKVISEREGTLLGEPIQLLARNIPSPVACQRCGRPATCRSSQQMRKGEENLCESCAQEYLPADVMCLPLLNSPREGVCNYIGQHRSPR